MSLSIKDVEDLAELSKLELNQEEKEKLLSDMEGIFGYLKQIEEIENLEIKPVITNYNSWREDLPKTEQERDFNMSSIQEQFPDSKNGFVKVKKIL